MLSRQMSDEASAPEPYEAPAVEEVTEILPSFSAQPGVTGMF
jgi:hypothetical protein